LRHLGLDEAYVPGQAAFVARDGLVDILFGHLDAVSQRLNRGPELSRNSLACANAVTVQMIATVLAESGPTKEADVASAAKAYIDRHLQDRNLTPAAVARGLHVSARTLYRSFAGTGQGVAEYMRSARLHAAKRESELRAGKVNINVVAERWGFGDPSRFASLFRQKFGRVPSDYVRDL
jgi:AraC-like DNA-binding protein